MSQPVWFVCAYFGPGDECLQCGFGVPYPGERGDRFCCDDCAAGYADRVEAMERRRQERRDREDEFGRRCDNLRKLGFVGLQIDILLAGFPT